MISGSVAFRADASIEIGSGHVVRCIALAEALRSRGADCTFICRAHPGHSIDQIRARGFAVARLADRRSTNEDWLGCSWQKDMAETQDVLKSLAPAWLVVDHYSLDSRWEHGLRSLGTQILVIDDLQDRQHDCDLFLNQNLGASAPDYEGLLPASARARFGPRFALIRAEFKARRPPLCRPPAQGRWLACVGGVDRLGILETILAAWDRLPKDKPHLDVAVGDQTPNLDVLVRTTARMTGVKLHAPADRIADLMAGADVLLCAGGTINWERCCLGIPAIIGTIADNQRTVQSALTRARTGISVGEWQNVTAERLAGLIQGLRSKPRLTRSLAIRAHSLVDGSGADRVAQIMFPESVTLRPATAADAAPALRWRNAASTRKYSFDSSKLATDEHQRWWTQSIDTERRDLLVASVRAEPVAIVRLDHLVTDAKISIYVDPERAGCGIGTLALLGLIAWCREHRPLTRRLIAQILAENRPSLAAFRKAGFLHDRGQWLFNLCNPESTP